MTPEEKAKELGKKYSKPCHGTGDCEFEATQAALEMAQWKEQQMIDKAVKWLKSNRHIKDDVVWNIYIDNFKRTMEEE